MAHTLPSSSISLESRKRCRPQPSTGIDPQPYFPPIDPGNELHHVININSPWHPVINSNTWPTAPFCRESWAGTLASYFFFPDFGLLGMEDASLIAEKIEDEAYKAADAADDISPEERRSMYENLMFTKIEKYRLSESELAARLESDPRYSAFRPTSNWLDDDYEPLYEPPPWDPRVYRANYARRQQYSEISSHESLGAIQVISSEQAQLQTPHVPSCVTTSSQQRLDSGMSSHESLEAIQAILSDKDKLGQVLLQHPNLLKVLQEKLEQH